MKCIICGLENIKNMHGSCDKCIDNMHTHKLTMKQIKKYLDYNKLCYVRYNEVDITECIIQKIFNTADNYTVYLLHKPYVRTKLYMIVKHAIKCL